MHIFYKQETRLVSYYTNECSMYTAANVAKEISAKREQKKALEGIQNKLPSQSIVPNNESNERISGAIQQIENEVLSLDRKLHSAEKDVMRHFHEAIDEICKRYVHNGTKNIENELQKKLDDANDGFQRKTEEIKANINTLRTTKMNFEDGNKKIAEMGRETQHQLSVLIHDQVEGLRTQNKAAFTEIRGKYHELSSTNYKDQLRADVTRDVAEYVKQKFRPEELHTIKEHVMKIVEQNQRTATTTATTASSSSSISQPPLEPEQYIDLIRSEVQKYAQNKDELQKQLSELDEWNTMKNKMKDLGNKIDKEATSTSSSKTVLQNLQNDLSQLFRKLDLIQKQMDTITNKSTSSEEQARELTVLNRRLQDVARDLAVNSSQLEMTQTWDAFSETESARLKNNSQRSRSENGTLSTTATEEERQRKRQRIGDASSTDNSDRITSSGANDTQLEEKIKTLEQKQNSLTEYLDTFRTNVLNPEFPERLQSTMTDIEMVLRSHEEFISHLVDPIRAARGGSVDLTTSTNNPIQIPHTLSPAMIQAIQTLVKNTAEQTAKPLLERIALLEAKLNQRN
ncbi:hypothetical protein BDA99DRAFT_538611 [Phascolomyces articulosus]|uniref:Uncharacterized protein n=1 Tax=Phascolomyces articulosus TaxID=60185 RepID=A0AAD5PCN9_9FUNG|nr:hypothetical protein BDA99DRAFT_538611 [Phascolomyces articulosus]